MEYLIKTLINMKNFENLTAELAKGQIFLARNAITHTSALPEVCLKNIGQRIEDKTAEITQALIDKKPQKELTLILAGEVVRASEGIINVPEFYARNKSEQETWIYIGTHWTKFNTQRLHDFLREWAKTMGLPESLITDEGFMHKFYTRVLFNLKNKKADVVNNTTTVLNLMNGTLEIDNDGNVKLRPHDKEDFIDYVLPYSYDADASYDLFQKYITDVLPEEDVRNVVQEYFGYILTRSLRLEKMLLLYGTGSNGKSVLLDCLLAMIGKGNASFVMLSDFDNDQKLASMNGKIVNVSYEAGDKLPAEKIKTAITGEPIMVKRLYKDPFPMSNYGKLVVSYNKLPKAENTWAFFRRLLLVKFNVTVNKEHDDKNLSEKLCNNEVAGILNWAIEGLQRLIKNGDFSDSPTIVNDLYEYKREADHVKIFIEDHLVKDENAEVKGSAVLQAYRKFCYEEEIDRKNVLGRNKFLKRLEQEFKADTLCHQKYYKLRFVDIYD